MAAEPFIPGEVATLTMRVTTLDGISADPGTITLKIESPASGVADYIYGVAAEIVRDGEGLYRAEIPLNVAGRWYYRWDLASPNAGAVEGSIEVKRSRFVQS
ncbi:MAG: hypothetical protein CVU31_02480 [Betaproteobacteria bacterium HGW-Betaproteobacteria-4]|jgi:hypothetical protein|nr:MAG: hypothetical protein CVU31_02480 [Betaproteobacteria bacterium HGW-Betaproteobacteria-4]